MFLGNVILGKFPINLVRSQYQALPEGLSVYHTVIDGLQRFTIGTALLCSLYDIIFSETAERSDLAHHLSFLKKAITDHSIVFLHNRAELKEHNRKAISRSFNSFYTNLVLWLKERLVTEPDEISSSLKHLFLSKQVAIDKYSGFETVYEVATAFIGLNTIRAELNKVDWLRSVILEKASGEGWGEKELKEAENYFTETFVEDKKPKAQLFPFVGLI